MSEFVYLNGSILPAAEAKVSAFDAGFTHAAGLFETLRAYNGRVMRLADHLDRLTDSAASLDMRIDVDRPTLQQAAADLLAANELQDARLRLVMTPGDVPRPGPAAPEPCGPTTFISASAVQSYPEALYATGMRVCISPYRQSRLDPLAGHKTLGYFPRLLAMKDASDRQCSEALWFNTDHLLAEGSVSNVFIVTADGLVTPPVDTPVLPGTVRKAVIELAEANAIPIEQRSINIDQLLAATEVFLTGSVLEIMPVTAIEKHDVGDGTPGEMAKRLRGLYTAMVAAECSQDRE